MAKSARLNVRSQMLKDSGMISLTIESDKGEIHGSNIKILNFILSHCHGVFEYSDILFNGRAPTLMLFLFLAIPGKKTFDTLNTTKSYQAKL